MNFSVFSDIFNDDFWFPTGVTWSSFKSTPRRRYVDPDDLYLCVIVLPIMFLVRSLFLLLVASNLGRLLGLKDRKHVALSSNPTDSTTALLEEAFKVSPTPTTAQVDEIVKRTDLREIYILRWFRRQRHSLKPSRLDKFNESCLYFAWYATIFGFGIFALRDEIWFLDTRHFWIDYPDHPLSDAIYYYYLASISFYLNEVIITMFKNIKRADDLQMTIHHLVTLSLLTMSWWINQIRIGSVVLVLHDFGDIWLQLGKMARYVRAEKCCDAAFTMLAISWLVTRLVIFPLYPVYSVAFEAKTYVDFKSGRLTVWHSCLGLLLALLVMNAIWFGRIMIAVVEKIKYGEVRDNRERQSEDEED